MRTRLLGWFPVVLCISLATPVSSQEQTFQRPLQFRGLVVLEDGTPAPADVVIEASCNATTQAVTHPAPNGAFSVAVGGSTQGLVADASNPGSNRQSRAGAASGGDWADSSSSRDALIGCELQASLPGFRSDAVPLYGYGPYETDIDLGTIVLRPRGEVQGSTVSITTEEAPKKARKAYENGLKRAGNGKLDEAETLLRQAVEEYPGYAVAWQALGEVLEAQQRPAEAREAYEKAVEADGSYISPHLLIALLAARENNWQEMEAAAGQVIELDPYDFPEAYYFQSVARVNLNDLAGAESSAREAIERGAQERYPQVESVLGLVLSGQGKFAEASEHFKKYLELNPDGGDVEIIRNRLAEVNAQIAAQSQP